MTCHVSKDSKEVRETADIWEGRGGERTPGRREQPVQKHLEYVLAWVGTIEKASVSTGECMIGPTAGEGIRDHRKRSCSHGLWKAVCELQLFSPASTASAVLCRRVLHWGEQHPGVCSVDHRLEGRAGQRQRECEEAAEANLTRGAGALESREQ